MEKKITITYNWRREDTTYSNSYPKPEHLKALEESATDRIFEMLKDGYTSGELHDNIFMNDDDINEAGEQGIEYSGWWDMTTETIH